jgi:hypothetical protein
VIEVIVGALGAIAAARVTVIVVSVAALPTSTRTTMAVSPTPRSMAEDSAPDTTGVPATRTVADPAEAVGVRRNVRVRYPTFIVYDRWIDENEGDSAPVEGTRADRRVSGMTTAPDVAVADPSTFDFVSTNRTKPGSFGVYVAPFAPTMSAYDDPVAENCHLKVEVPS